MSEQSPSILVVIPARKGSSFHRKNLQPFHGKPLIRWAIESSQVKQPHSTIITTDDPYVMEEASATGSIIDERPEPLCDDFATLDQVMFHIATKYHYDIYVCLPPTSPLRTEDHVRVALALFMRSECDSLVSVTEEKKAVWRLNEDGYLKPIVERTVNRQQCTPVYISNGAIFMTKRDVLLKTHRKISGLTMPYIMDTRSSLDIHSEEDLRIAEALSS